MNNDLKLIKKKYGEDMMHFCRQTFPTILEVSGLLLEILTESFAENKELYQDIVNDKLVDVFKEYIYFIASKKISINQKQFEDVNEILKTPSELLSEAGYDLYECHTEKDIQSFKKYYAKGEELCTFERRRLDECYVFFAIKKNVDSIKRENFEHPNRQDEYGTSVISIQFNRNESNTISIKNRYNHTVVNPDATFSNNLDNIIPGLEESFKKTYNLSLNVDTDRFFTDDDLMLYYIKGNDKRIYKSYLETDKYYFCPNNIVIDKQTMNPTQYDKNEFIFFENYILDLKNKKFVLLNETGTDSFIESLQDISKISINLENKLKIIKIYLKDKETPVVIKIDQNSRIVELENIYLEKLDNNFLHDADKLKKLVTPNATEVGKNVCYSADNLETLDMPRVKKIGSSSFSRYVKKLKEINLPCLEEIESEVFMEIESLEKINVPKLKKIGRGSFRSLNNLEGLNMPSLEEVGDCSFVYAFNLERINLPQLKKVGNSSFRHLNNLEELNMPNLEEVGDFSFDFASNLKRINLPSTEKIGDYVFEKSSKLEKINASKLKFIGDYSFNDISNLKELNLPSTETIGDYVFEKSSKLEKINASKLKFIGNYSFNDISNLKELNLPSTEKIGDYVFEKSSKLEKINIPRARKIGINSFGNLSNLIELNMPNIKKISADLKKD